MKTIRYTLENGIATITFDEEGSPVNTMCAQWQADLREVTAQVLRDGDVIKGIVLASNKPTFFAGADLKATMQLTPSDGPRLFTEIEAMKKCFRTLETLGKPVVTCLNGAALGGGWEVALIGHHRIAVDNPKILLGLPEITLGLIPGATGITKMTRLLGLVGAQPYILESRLFNPQQALELGLVHELVPDAAALRPAALAWIAAHPQAVHPWDDRNYKMPGGTPADPKIAAALSVAPAILRQKTRGLYPAPEYALCAMAEGASVDYDTALRIESRYLARVAVTQVARNMINTFFFNMNAVRASQSRPKDNATFTTRVLAAYVMEGAAMAGEGIPAAVIESAGIQAGMPQGPLAAKGEAAPLPAGRHNPARDGIGAGTGAAEPMNMQELRDRLLYRQAIEAARCLHEGVVATVHDANIGSISGIGFPAWTGGALQFIYGTGVDAFAVRADELAARHGPGFMLDPPSRETLAQNTPRY